MTVFIAGGAGYIGSHTILELLKQGYEVVAADNFSNSKPEALNRVKRLAGRDFPFYQEDIRDETALDRIFTAHKIDCLIHFAGFKAVGESLSKPLAYYANNLNSTIALCGVMRRYHVNKMIFSSSATVYDRENEMPLTEESKTGNCLNPYGWTKYMCEQIIKDAASADKNQSVALLRYFNPIGAHESGEIGEDPQDVPNNIMPYISQTAIGRREFILINGDDYDTPDGTCIRDYVHIMDLAAGHVAAIRYLNNNTGAFTFNLGTGKGTSVIELIQAFERAADITLHKNAAARRAGDLPVCYTATEKAKRELDWTAQKSIADACADAWRWQRNNPNGYGV